jgi:cytochrome c peroxidase
MRNRKGVGLALVVCIVLAACSNVVISRQPTAEQSKLDQELANTLTAAGFTGRIESTLETRLGRPIDRELAEIGRLLWFDTIGGLNDDNTCAGCHSPTAGFGDTQSIAIGIESNSIVGPHRTGPRNMRRTPTVINTAFYPRLMWNSRFRALSDDPFDSSKGFEFPAPEGNSLSHLPHLLTAQAFIPPTERNEVAGFDFEGDNNAIRAAVLERLNDNTEYREKFGSVYPEVQAGAPISFEMFGAAIAEFEFTLTFANAPIDRFARGEHNALTAQEKEGALLFFGKANCVQCHGVAGTFNEMFSDFQDYVIGVPPLMPSDTNSDFDGNGVNEDFGKEQVTGAEADRYKFRASPLRNVGIQPTFMHNGAFTTLEDAIRHHLDARGSLLSYIPEEHSIAADLCVLMGPVEPILERIDPLLATPTKLSAEEFDALVAFVGNGLLDPRARPENLRYLVPAEVPSKRETLRFEFP